MQSNDITTGLQKAHNCKIVKDVRSHRLKQSTVDGNSFDLFISDTKTLDDLEVEIGELYAIDIVTSTEEPGI